MREFRRIMVALLMAVATEPVAAPALAQQSESQLSDPTADAVGLPVYTSDGERLGEVVQIASYGDKPALRAEIGTFLGLGATTAIIPGNMFQRNGDRVVLGMTAAEVKDTIAKQK